MTSLVLAAPSDPSGIAAVAFDLDGVLIDTDAAVASLWRRVAGRHGRALDDEAITRHVYGCAPAHTIDAIFPEADAQSKARIAKEIDDAEPDLGFRAIPGARELVAALHRQGVALALVTSGSAMRVARVLHALGLHAAFPVRVTLGEAASKPAPDGYVMAARRLGVAPERCVVFEDSINGVRAAVAAGAVCVGIAARGDSATLERLGAVCTIVDFSTARVHRAGGEVRIEL